MMSSAGSGPVVAGLSGAIEEVGVSDRGSVAQGQVLAVIKSDGDSTIASLEQRKAIATARKMELTNLITCLQASCDASLVKSSSEYQAWLARAATFDARISTAVQVMESSAAAVDESQNGLAIADRQMAVQRDLAARGLLARNRVLDLELQHTEARRSHQAARSTLAQARLALEGARRERESAQAELLARLEAELRSQSERLEEIESALQTSLLTRGNGTVTAPLGGYVEAVEPLYVGKNVTVGMPLYSLTPVSTDFMIKVSVSNKDVGHVSIDDLARVRIPALGGGRFKIFRARVTRVSEEAVPQPVAMMMLAPDARRAPEFVVHLELIDAVPGDTLRLKAGMYAEAEIFVSSKRSAAGFAAETLLARGIRPMSEP